MARRKKKDSQSEAGTWLMTYADMITLVLTFFILLFTMSVIDVAKFNRVVAAVQSSLGVLDGGKTLDPDTKDSLSEFEDDIIEIIRELELEEENIKRVVANLDNLLEVEGLQDSVYIVIDERGINIRFLDHVLYARGQASLKPEALPILDKVANVLREIDNNLRVEGYTCDLPIRTAQFPSNWELSTRRATTVVRYLQDRGIPGERLSAVGYGEYRPLVANTNEENRRQNRRVDIVIMRDKTTLQ